MSVNLVEYILRSIVNISVKKLFDESTHKGFKNVFCMIFCDY